MRCFAPDPAVPGSAGSDAKHRTELIRLRRELDEAVQEEQYEDAARIRDRIHNLETELPETS